MNRSCCKAGKIINRYQLSDPNRFDSINNYLVSRWCGEDGLEKTGLRPLTDWFNKRILKAVYSRQSRYQIESHIESDYELLHSASEDKTGERQELLQDLHQDDIDGEAVSGDFISISTLHRHLTDCLGEEKKRETSDRDWERNQVSLLRERIDSDLNNVLTSLDNKDRIVGAADVDPKITLYLQCPECSCAVSFERALHQGYVCEEHLPLESSDKEPAQKEPDQDAQSTVSSNQSTLTDVGK